MSEIYGPKQVISDEDYEEIAPELVSKIDYDGELEDYEVDEFNADEAAIVANYDKWINMTQLNADLSATSTTTSVLTPASIIRVLSKTARTLPSGQIVVDYELELESVAGADSYEVRVLQQ